MRFIFASLAFATSLSFVSAARADDALGAPGQFILSADRLMPLFSYDSVKTSADSNNSSTQATTSIGLLTSTPSPSTFFTLPRVGVDYSVAQNITVGGSAFVFLTPSSSTEVKSNGTAQSRDSSTITYWGVAPRAGYVLGINDKIALWARAGITYASLSVKTPGTPQANGATSPTVTNTLNQLAIDLEPMFVFTPIPHFGITAGPVVDIPLTGTQSSDAPNSRSLDSSQFHLGLTAGILGYF